MEHYIQEDRTVNLVSANLVALGMIVPTLFLFGLPFYLIWIGGEGIREWMDTLGEEGPGGVARPFAGLALLLAGIAVHELIHGITWSLFAKRGWKSIRFGVLWKMLTPYCHCKEPLLLEHYILGALMPGLLMGIFPAILAIILGNGALLLFGIFFTIAATGDFLIIYTLRKERKGTLVQDHPSQAGCIVFLPGQQEDPGGESAP